MTGAHEPNWSRLPRDRFRPAGPRRDAALTWTTRGAVACALLGVLWLGFTLLRPLPEAPAVELEPFPELPRIERAPRSPDDRGRVLALLTADNLFDDAREKWTRQAAAPPSPTGASGTPDASADVAAKPASPGETLGGTTIIITATDAAPDDVKKALTGLALRGIYTPPPRAGQPASAATPVAMISRVMGTPSPLLADSYRAGDQFDDASHPGASWKIVAVEPAGRRVILARSGVNVALPLDPPGSGIAPPPASSAAPDSEAGVQVVSRTPDELRAELREAGVSDEQIARLLNLAAATPEERAAQAKLRELAGQAPPAPAAQAPDAPPRKRRAPPPGLEAVARMLQQSPVKPGQTPVPEEPAASQPDASPAPAVPPADAAKPR